MNFPDLISYSGARKSLLLAACLLALALAIPAIAVQSAWDAPAAQLAEQIAALLGPGQVQLDLANRSSLPASEIPPFARLWKRRCAAEAYEAEARRAPMPFTSP